MVLQSQKKIVLFTLCILLCQYFSLAQAGFTAKISPVSIGKDETAELRLMIENARQVDQIIPPSLNDFIVVSGPNQESGMESSNGVTRQYIGITYLLRPKSTGKFTIGQAIAKADGKTFRSNRVTLVVTKNSSGNNPVNASPGLGGLSVYPEPEVQSSFDDFIIRKDENIAEKIRKNIFIKVDVSKQSCFVGEPVMVTYKLYTRLKSESSITKNPSFNGFSVIDLFPPGNTYYSDEKLNGRSYNVYTLRKSQLYPLQAGVVELESAEVENNIHFIKEEYIKSQQDDIGNLFREFSQTSIPPEGMQDEKVTLASKPALITVKPLPEKDKPIHFKGAVGNFRIEASLEKNNFSTEDAGKLIIAISGEGNMSMIIAPDVSWPGGLEPFESKTREQLNKQTIPVSGIKLFEFPFTAGKAGAYIIPEISFSYFDPATQKYKTVNTKPLSIAVEKGIGKKQVIMNTDTGRTGKGQFFDTLFNNRWLIVIPLAILILTGLFIWLQKERKNNSPVFKPGSNEKNEDITKNIAIEEIPQPPSNPFNLTEEKMARQDTVGFYESLNIEFRNFLAAAFQISPLSINKIIIGEEADKKGLPVHTTLLILQLLDDIEWQLYTPFASEDKMAEMYGKAKFIVNAMDTTIQ